MYQPRCLRELTKMLTEKDKIEQFKRDLRSYTYHQKKAMEIDEKLEELEVKLLGVSSPSAKEIVLENSGNPYGDNKVQLMMEEEELEKEINHHLNEIIKVDTILSKAKESDRNMLIDVYVKHLRHVNVADKYGYTRIAMYKRIDKILRKLL